MNETRTLAEQLISEGFLGRAVLDDEFDETPPAPNGYELVAPIGRGGGGTVYLARDTTLDRPAAIKFLRDAGPAEMERFRREARFTARLNCASIVQVYELGEIDGQPYIAMQYLDGGNFAEADLDHAGIVGVLREVAEALRHAHAEGIVHRDIKPENILLDREGRAYVADFGIAHDLHGSVGETMSRKGQIIGTPGMMPPEQARGDHQAVDARSDVYAIGATLFFKLTGRYPFQGTNLVDVLHAVVHDDPPLPRSLDPSIPSALESIVIRCMRKVRNDRYQSVDEIIADFDRFLPGAAVGGDTSATSAWFRRLVHQRPDAPVVRTDDDAESANWTVGLGVVREIAAWDADRYRVSGSLERSFARLDALCDRLDAILAERPDLAWARFYRGVVLFRRGRLGCALEEMERAIDRVKDRAGAYAELGRIYLALYLREHHDAHKHLSPTGVKSSLESARTRLEQAAVALQEAQRLQGELPAWHEEYARAVTHLADGDFGACVAVCDELIAVDPDVEEVWKLRGDALHLAGDDPFDSYDHALDVRRSYYEALLAKAEAHLARDQRADARVALERAVTIHPEYVPALALLARTYLEDAQHGASDDSLAEGRLVAERALAHDDSDYDAAVSLAEIMIECGRDATDDEWHSLATGALAKAKTLPGCQNRVSLLTAQAHLQHARHQKDRGVDPGATVEAIRALSEGLPLHRPGMEAWVEMREVVAREFG